MKAFHKLALGAAAVLVAGVFTPVAGAAQEPRFTPRDRQVLGDPVGEPAPAMALGVIVKYRAGAEVAHLRRNVRQLTGAQTSVSSVAPRVRAINTEPMPLADAEELAAEIAERPDVVWAEPNGIDNILADNPWPVPVNDTYASLLRNVWDIRGPEDSWVSGLGVTPWPAGGYGTKSPAVWRTTTGKKLVVAVVDTGIINHPDLQPNVIAGYDLISAEPGGTFIRANDGDGRDPNPADPGDWVTTDLGCGAARNSSWHGTHVAGTIGAVANNGQGIAGIAPGVRIQPVRVLGRCGASSADVDAAIRWAAGAPVEGVPTNRTPAKIINLSLGGSGACSQSRQDAIQAARSRGAAVVVALGNSAQPAANFTPANCPGVIGVHSVSDYGDPAYYSNYGPEADISAPGGDISWGENGGITSTIDTGTTAPAGPGYGAMQGTSMAAPAASAVAALLASVGSFTPDQLEAALRTAVTAFPTGSPTYGFVQCTPARCGTGILDMTRVPMPRTAPRFTGAPVVGQTLRAVSGSWQGPAGPRTFTWYVGSRAVGNGATYRVSRLDVGQRISVRQSASGAFAPIGATSAGQVAKFKSTLKVKAPKSLRTSARGKVTIRVTVAGVGKPLGKVTIKIGKRVVAKGQLKAKSKGKLVLRLPKLKAGKQKLVVTYAGNARTAASTKKATVTVRR